MSPHRSQSTIFIVEDDEFTQEIIAQLVESVGLRANCFACPILFLKNFYEPMQGCVLLDVRLPEMSGLEVYDELKKRHCTLPIIFMSAYHDISVAVRAIQAGAVDFISKPFNNQMLLEKIQKAISLSPTTTKKMQFLKRLEQLTRREKEIVKYLIEGKTNKEIAGSLSISCSTVELHRSNILSKMQVKNSVEFIKNYWKKVSL